MALTAIPAVLTADKNGARPEWHRWHSPTGRCWAARTVSLADPTSGPMIVSADSDAELDAKLVNASAAPVEE